MKWEDRRRSSNVTRSGRGSSFGRSSRNTNSYQRSPKGRRGGRMPIPIPIPTGGRRRRGGIGGGGIGCGTIILILVLYMVFNGLFSGGNDDYYGEEPRRQPQPQTQTQSQLPQNQNSRERMEDFLSVVLADTEDVWHEKFAEYNREYTEPRMNLYEGTTRSGCGVASNRMGPFYCPNDEVVYIDVSFYNDLVNNYGGGGDFAFAYVLAHEVGHHVQKELGILQQTAQLRRQLPEKEYNKYSVAQELQADYFAGLFTFYVEQKGYLEAGDIEEAMAAAAGVGDDRIHEMQGVEANVDNFTHGTSKQRKEAFDLGYQYHDLEHSMIFFDNIENAPQSSF